MTDEDYLFDPAAPPDPEIARLEALLRPVAYRPAPLRVTTYPRRDVLAGMRGWSVAAATLLLAAGALVVVPRTRVTPWSVTARAGAPVVRGAHGEISRETLVRGGVVETDAHSSALVRIGHIGRAELGPDSRLRLLADGGDEHRLALERGTMHASIDAPPRFFLVQTTSALAVDLGCVYTLTASERGSGLLTVDEGEVELQFGAVRSSVLAGNAAALLSGRGPGLPYPVRAPLALRSAIATYDTAPSPAAIAAVIQAADARSTITLWHLLQRVDSAERGAVYARLAAIAPPPRTVTRDRVLRAESGALQRWRTELQRSWVTEPPLWRRLANALSAGW
jgi:hypothetical protein